MCDEKIKADCRLIAKGTDKANAKVVDDLRIPDPESAIGNKIIKEAIGDETDNDDKPETSE